LDTLIWTINGYLTGNRVRAMLSPDSSTRATQEPFSRAPRFRAFDSFPIHLTANDSIAGLEVLFRSRTNRSPTPF
jgi:hypothetical protein